MRKGGQYFLLEPFLRNFPKGGGGPVRVREGGGPVREREGLCDLASLREAKMSAAYRHQAPPCPDLAGSLRSAGLRVSA